MIIKTKFFGEQECANENVLTFEDGIPGFAELKKFVVIGVEDNANLSYLQSLEDENTCFVVAPPSIIVGNYDIEISKDVVDKLQLKSPKDANLYTILNIPDEIKNMTANLQAPIIVNAENNKGVQGILEDTKYEIKHPVFIK